MANYFTHFSCLLDVGTPSNAALAVALFQQLRLEDQEADEPQVSGFDLSIQDGPDSSILWLRDDEHSDIEQVIGFVLRVAADLDLSGLWGFEYSNSCSRPRLGAFGGGAHVIDFGARKSIGWISTHEWLTAALNGEDIDAVEALAQ